MNEGFDRDRPHSDKGTEARRPGGSAYPEACAAALPEPGAAWALFVREPFAGRIMAGTKTWEIRKRRTTRRGRIGILSERGLLGTVELHDVAGPFAVADLAAHVDKHRAPLSLLARYADGRDLYAWILREPQPLDEPVVFRRGRGPMVWFRLAR